MRHNLAMGWSSICVAGALLAVAGCGSSDHTGPSANTTKDYITGVQATITPATAQVRLPGGRGGKIRLSPPASPPTQVTAAYHTGTAPSGTSGPQAATAAQSTPLVGQPLRIIVSGSGSFSTIYISIGGADGYWQLDLPSSVTAAALILQLAATPPQGSFDLRTALGASGSAGPAASNTISTSDLAHADVAAVVSWSVPSDVDLHVLDPNGYEVYFGQTSSPEGGKLDIDSNAACDIDNVDREIISWPQGTAPHGTYKVWVEYFDDCQVTSTPWTLTVSAKGSGGVLTTVSGGNKTGTFSGVGNGQPSDTVTFTF